MIAYNQGQMSQMKDFKLLPQDHPAIWGPFAEKKGRAPSSPNEERRRESDKCLPGIKHKSALKTLVVLELEHA
jgi:hypothetical protein